jgi:hypothetical protein
MGFIPVRQETDVALDVQGDPPLTWSAPLLADADVARITLLVDASNSVIVTVEPTWRRCLKLLLNKIVMT